jgi:hypothetical protein
LWFVSLVLISCFFFREGEAKPAVQGEEGPSAGAHTITIDNRGEWVKMTAHTMYIILTPPPRPWSASCVCAALPATAGGGQTRLSGTSATAMRGINHTQAVDN